MRMLMKVSLPIVEGTAAVADGSLGSTIGSILADLTGFRIVWRLRGVS